MTIRPIFTRAAAVAALVLAAGALGIGGVPKARAAGCQTVSSVESEDEEPMTAAKVVSGTKEVTITGSVDATGCDIGVYIAPGARAKISYADIYSTSLGTAFGVYNDGGRVTIEHSKVHGILGNGESCGGEDDEDGGGCSGGGGGDRDDGMGGGEEDRGYIGGRHGTAILFVGSAAEGTTAQGTISSSTVSDYGRRGISVSGPSAWARITGNQIIAPTDPISWLNGVWVANGAHATIANNVISGNVTGGNANKASSAIMVAGGTSHNSMPHFTTGIQISGNTLVDNDIGVLLSNADLVETKMVAPDVPTSNDVTGNTIRTSFPVHSNHAGIKDAGGNGDHITGNRIYGYDDNDIVTTPLSLNTLVEGNKSSG